MISHTQGVQGAVEELWRGLPHDLALDSRAVLEAGNERARPELQPGLALVVAPCTGVWEGHQPGNSLAHSKKCGNERMEGHASDPAPQSCGFADAWYSKNAAHGVLAPPRPEWIGCAARVYGEKGGTRLPGASRQARERPNRPCNDPHGCVRFGTFVDADQRRPGLEKEIHRFG